MEAKVIGSEANWETSVREAKKEAMESMQREMREEAEVARVEDRKMVGS